MVNLPLTLSIPPFLKCNAPGTFIRINRYIVGSGVRVYVSDLQINGNHYFYKKARVRMICMAPVKLYSMFVL